ncbi:YidC/Oxa1 family membrane protein insertase [Brevundimonas bullata]|uniref:Membrane protein insertase YidC n=1 Tax=Brevundimonas bullata TaxID=13160 RepID=A0A7W7IPH3_9CAUL|nr:membrane protein insertase YidC [Brevundimonas bullata]MBB4798144.1 YidC/Oxa1 family membrane protein insertase [Brevundimonas bullata]MBB6383542.1 YidC/Oxa1 family membrane protein insertase [Brevundimonas bullata]
MQNENSRNTIIFFVCAALIMGVYYFMVMRPQAEMRRQQQVVAAEQQAATADGGLTSGSAAPAAFVADRAQALGTAARVPIQTPKLKGSLSLQGARIDDLYLTDYKETLDKNSPPVELFRPQGMEHAYFAQFGWSGPNVAGGVPGPNTPWALTKGATLTPTTPVELTWDNGQGLRFTRVIAIDDQYVFTVSDTVANLSGQPITIAPYGRVERQGVPADLGKQMILHEGAIGAFGANGKFTTEQVKYKDWAKKPRIEKQSTGGWLGITDKYWMAALIPDQKEAIEGRFAVRDPDGLNVHEAAMLGATRTIQPGRQIEETQRLFAGAKRNEILAGYEKSLDLPRFVYAIDWGMFWFLTRPIFMIVEFFYGVLGNFGLAILALTVVVKLIMFPLANKSYESLSKMRTLQPKMEEIKKKFKDDPQKQQQETMALYQREKINPLAGCLPILVQIPVFYALYKVLFVTIEMRHAPFFGWIRDLSARDPSTIWNLFGAIPWDPATLPLVGSLLNGPLHLGVLPIVYGLTMWLQQSMNPPAQDPMQRQIFAFLPFIFTFIMAPFAAGLLIYWAWNNILSIAQQYVIMHRFKAENPIDTFLARFKKA